MGIFRKTKMPTQIKKYTTYDVMPHVSWVPNWTKYSSVNAINRGYKRSTWVYDCVRLRANNIAGVPFKTEVLRGDQWEEDGGNELYSVLTKPNRNFDLSMMLRQAVYSLDLTGDAYFSLIRDGRGMIREIWPLVPDEMKIKPGRSSMVEKYEYRRGSISRTFEPEEILHLKYANPADIYYGLSVLEAAARAVDIDEEAERWQKTSLQNMGVPPFALTLEGDITQDQYDQAKANIKDQTGPDHAREPWVLANAKVQQIAQSATDLDFIEGRKMTREEICSAFAVPPPLVGIYENATLANIETARKILWLEGLIPVLDEIVGQMNLQLTDGYGDNIRIVYDISGVDALQENYGEKITNAKGLWSMGIPLTEINRKLELGLDLDNVAGADVGYLPSGLLPADFELSENIPGSNALAQEATGDDQGEA